MSNDGKPFPLGDLRTIADAVAPQLGGWQGARLLVTGATGFFGRWLLESVQELNRSYGLGLQVVAQSRDPERFLARVPHLRSPEIRWWQVDPFKMGRSLLAGDRVATDLAALSPNGALQFDAVVHLVTEADGAATVARPVEAVATIADTTRRALELALAAGARRVLFTSSGSVYGRFARSTADDVRALISEDDWGTLDPTDVGAAYAISGHAKRVAEQWCAIFAAEHDLPCTIARCFSFLGPGLPLTGKFAAGNFMGDALAGRDITIRSEGRAERSYLYASDMVTWLWKILFAGEKGRAYNVGSEEAVSLRQLADLVRQEVAPKVEVRVLGQSGGEGVAARFVPSTARARQELGLAATVGLADAIRRTAAWSVEAGA